MTQWDLIEYEGDCKLPILRAKHELECKTNCGWLRTDTNTPGFPSCGDIPEVYTTGPSATIYYTECNIIPRTVERQDRIKMYKTEVDLTLTCYTDEGEDIIGNT